MRKTSKFLFAAAFAAGIVWSTASVSALPVHAAEAQITAEDAAQEEYQEVVTEYSDLWTGNVTFQKGEPVRWYVHVPEGTEPKGCGATIKIPGLGWGTDAHNKDEGHLTLTQGDNLVYEFTPEETGDFLFTCWMGAGCHSNYLHVTEDGSYTVPAPADPADIRAERDGSSVTVYFTAPEAPEGARITGYKVFAVDADGKRTKATGTESPVTLENLDADKTYTVQVITLATSGASAGEHTAVLEAVPEQTTTEAPAETKPQTESVPTETTTAGTSTAKSSTAKSTSKTTSGTTEATTSRAAAEQVIITEYADLWTGNITVKQGIPVKWYVNVPEKADLTVCDATIKIPGLGWGTDTDNSHENHLTLKPGKQLVYEFTPEKTGDILFTCLMGSGCHGNYIHVVADAPAGSTTKASTTAKTTAKTSSTTAGSPKTGAPDYRWAGLILAGAAAVVLITKKKKH